ncbi:hypothetical protein [Corynebacterium sp. TAE3-ERU30]|uniref:hypothetical protein n=1 Tax=Corynebacterium sp. TAE3-ERU30 TaxID=2849496 RepID=UPI001C492E66|nr:hypothetical protein [Corynebacterium sp. TAE3-ERU30]MBV7282759.1 hypothetical protein [Corynebacterium sp. TAE3-ERU30]
MSAQSSPFISIAGSTHLKKLPPAAALSAAAESALSPAESRRHLGGGAAPSAAHSGAQPGTAPRARQPRRLSDLHSIAQPPVSRMLAVMSGAAEPSTLAPARFALQVRAHVAMMRRLIAAQKVAPDSTPPPIAELRVIPDVYRRDRFDFVVRLGQPLGAVSHHRFMAGAMQLHAHKTTRRVWCVHTLRVF